MGRSTILRRIQQLDSQRDHREITYLTWGYKFPWDTVRSLGCALFRTYAVPTISALLDAPGEFAHRFQHRYDDTSLLIAEMTNYGYDSEAGLRCASSCRSVRRSLRTRPL